MPWMSKYVLAGAALKVLLFPAYHSTDFDVHRNWLAITANLPMSEWYRSAVSQWTLDYPPFFAYFEWALSQLTPSSVVQDGALEIVEKGEYGWPTVVFQRTSVMFSELVFAAALSKFASHVGGPRGKAAALLLWFHPAWLILDHIHFQYNTALFGLLVASISAGMQQNYLLCAVIFASLLCFKHIYLYVAPAYIAFLLCAYVAPKGHFRPLNTIKLGLATLSPFVLAFGPFWRDLPQVLARLFPFSRGLTHAYWAPNFWALYSAADRMLGLLCGNSVPAGTRGLVGQVAFSNLWTIEPRTTFALTAGLQLLVAVPLARDLRRFVASVTLSAFAAFLFGWHVHEKAIMVVVVPFALIATQNRSLWTAFTPLLSSSCISLFPLVWTSAESVVKIIYSAAYLTVALYTLPDLVPARPRKFLLDRWIVVYQIGFIPVIMASSSLAHLIPRLEFAGLMLLSVYSALGVIASFTGLIVLYFGNGYLDVYENS